MQIGGFGSLEATWQITKPLVVHDMAKGVPSDFPLTNMGVAIDARPQVRFRIIEMKRQHLFETDRRLQLIDRCIPTAASTKIIPRGKEMSGVETNTQARGLVNLLIDCRQMRKRMSEASTLAGRVFESDANRGRLCGAKNFVQTGYNILDTGLLPGAEVRARMKNQKREPQIGGKLNFLDKRFERVLAIGRRGRSQIDEIARVTEHTGESTARDFVLVQGEIVRQVRFSEPLHVVLHEDLNDLTINARASLQGLPDPATGRHVSAENHSEQKVKLFSLLGGTNVSFISVVRYRDMSTIFDVPNIG